MAVRLPDASALGRRPVPQGNRSIAQQDTESAGRALAGLGATIGQVGEQLQQSDDEQKVLEYRRKLIEWDKVNVRDPEKGAASKTGKDAFDLPNTLGESFDKFASEAASGLTTNRQRKLAQEMAMGRREQITNWAAGHALQERKKFSAGEFAANMATALDSAQMNPLAAPAEIKTREALIDAQLGGQLGPDAVALAKKQSASEVHTSIVSKMIGMGNVTAANDYFTKAAASNGFVSKDYESLQTRLKQVTAADSGEKIGIEVAAKFDFSKTGEAVTAIDAMDAPVEVKAAARQFVVQRHTLQRQDFNEQQGEAMGVLGQKLYEAPGRPAISRTALVASDEYKALSEANRAAALKMYDAKVYSDALRAQASDARSIAALQRHETELRLQGAAAAYAWSDPEVLANTDRGTILQAMPVLGQHWVSALLKEKDELQDPAKLAVAVMDAQAFNTIADKAGYKATAKTKSDGQKAALANLGDEVRQAMIARQGELKRQLTQDEKAGVMQGIVDNKVLLDEWGSDPTKRAYELTEDEQKTAYVEVGGKMVKLSDIPPEDEVGIRAMLSRAGKAQTWQNIATQYVYSKSKKKPAASGMVTNGR